MLPTQRWLGTVLKATITCNLKTILEFSLEFSWDLGENLIVDYVWAPQKRNNIITYDKIRVQTSYLYTRKTKSTKRKKKDLLALTLYMILIDHPLLCCRCSVSKLCLTLCNPTDYSIPGSSVLHYLLEFAHMYPLSWWCYRTISSSAALFFFCFQSFPKSGKTSSLFQGVGSSHQVDKSIGALTSVLPMNI